MGNQQKNLEEHDMVRSDVYSKFILEMLPRVGEVNTNQNLSRIASDKSINALAKASAAWYSTEGFSRLEVFQEGLMLGRVAQDEVVWRVCVEKFTFFFCGHIEDVEKTISDLPTPMDEQEQEVKSL